MWPSGDGVLATLTFNTIDVGIYTLNLYDVKLANKYLHQYPIPKYLFNDHVIGWEDDNYHIFTVSNSSVSPVRLYQLHCMVQFIVSGSSGTTAFCNMTIPKALLSSPQGGWSSWTV
jgi:hypothetical protein